ncbi:MAG: DEAD/DEAH box helicase family protein, partial [Candidatus Nitrosopelagicus sp.]|nr:DEAD/DEAH box helicase family protein [Candidatus Nitrosopelagicus sp.]
MLNQFLPVEKLHQNLKDYLESWNFLLNQINPENITSIYQDSKVLAALHHALNIDKYGQVKFREELFQHAPDQKIFEFAKKIHISFSSFEETQSMDFRKKLASFRWGNNEQTSSFLEIFEYPEYLLPSESEKNFAMKHIQKAQNPLKPLKDYQTEVFFNSQNNIEFPNIKFLIQMPTGAGKTRVAMEIIAHFLNKKEGRQVIWLADRAELCEQAVEAFENTWSHLGKYDLNLYQFWGNSTLPPNIEGTSFVICMYQKIREPIKNGHLNTKGDLIVTDEAHNVLAKTYKETIENLKDFRKKQTRVIGLTATPGRGSGKSLENEKLASFFDNKIIGIDSKDLGVIAYLQRKNILSRCIRKPLKTNIQYTLTKKEWETLSKSYEREYPEGFLERVANDNRRNAIILLRLIELSKESKHILVFGASKKQSKLLCGLLIALNYSAVHVDGNTPSTYRKDVVE